MLTRLANKRVWVPTLGAGLTVLVMCPVQVRAQSTLPPPRDDVQVSTEYGIEFSTVGDINNPPTLIPRPGRIEPDETMAVGGVNHAFRIARLEVTTGQWLEFVNTFSTQSDDLQDFGLPSHWGGRFDIDYSGPGFRWRLADVPDAELLPVFGISWREAAMYCNWLHNDRSPDVSALTYGAYDTSTFNAPSPHFTDQASHSPGARFWIPTLDEWLKAAYYDPDRSGPGVGGWWLYPNSSDIPPVPGLPGVGEANTGFTLPHFGQLDIPLASYPATMTPYGLFDVSGQTPEWSEFIFLGDIHEARAAMGSEAGVEPYEPYFDQLGFFQTYRPWGSGVTGLRIAASIPSSGSPYIVLCLGLLIAQRIRRYKAGV